MQVVIAPDSFKGTLRADAVAAALAAGWLEARPGDQLLLRPMADGGEGTLEALAAAIPGARHVPVTVAGPIGQPHATTWLHLPAGPHVPAGTGVVELARTCGIELLDRGLEPWRSGTLGLGQAIAAALDEGVDRLVVCLGSSASTDAGLGLLSGLGARFADADGRPLGAGAAGLLDLAQADLAGLRPPPVGGVLVITDVTSPLFGATGAAAVFGPQKGLRPDEIPVVDAALGRAADLLDLDREASGAGAAGGAGAALRRWGGELVGGADEVARLIGLPGALSGADVVVTGEGAFDAQSSRGKVPAAVARLAADARVRALLVAGRIDADADTAAFERTISLTELASTAEAALAQPASVLRRAGLELARGGGHPTPHR